VTKLNSDLFERLRKTAAEEDDFSLRTELAGTGAKLGAGAGGLLGLGHTFARSKSAPAALVGGAVSGLRGGLLGGGVGYLSGLALEDFVDHTQLNPRRGAGSVSDAPAGVDKTASLFEKNAGIGSLVRGAGSSLGNYAKNVSGLNFMKAKNAHKTAPSSSTQQTLTNEKKNFRQAWLGTGAGAAATGGLVAGGAAIGAGDKLFNKNPNEVNEQMQQQAMEELFGRLEKTAAPSLDRARVMGENALAGAQGAIHGYGQNFVGKPYRTLKKQLQAGEPGAYESRVVDARNRMLMAQGGTAAGLGAAGAGAYALANQGDEEEIEQTAAERLRSRLDKMAGPMDYVRGVGSNIANSTRNAADYLRSGNVGADIREAGAGAVNSVREGVGNAYDATRTALGPGYINRVLGRDYDAVRGLSHISPEGVEDVRRETRLAQGLTGAGAVGVGGTLGAAPVYLAHRGDEEEIEQTAAERLRSRLEKTAAPEFIANAGARARQIGDNIADGVRGAIPENVRGAVRDYNDRLLGGEYRFYKNNPVGGQARIDEAKADMLRTQGLTAAGVGGAGAVGAGAYALADRGDEEEQTASTLFERLEKTAAKNPLKGAYNKTKQYFGDVSGRNVNKATRQEKNFWSNPGSTSVEEFPKQMGKLQQRTVDAVGRQEAARRGTAAAGAGALAGGGAVGTGVAVSNRKKKNEDNEEIQQTASEELQGLYKEAARAILNENIPSVKEHVDPMSKIRF
jgi:hypothetical protein